MPIIFTFLLPVTIRGVHISCYFSLTGLPMCMTYFVHPYEVLKCPQLSSTDKNACVPDKVGMGGKMGVEKCTQVYNLCVDPNLFK